MQDLQLSQDGEEDPGEHLMTILNNLKWKNGRFRCFFAFRDVRCQHTAFLTVVVLHRTVKNKEQLKLELQQPMTHFNGNNTAVRRRACQAKLAEGEMLKNVFRELVILSATAYEGDGLTGAIVPAAAIDPAHVALSFRNPVNIDDIKGTRKLLEMTSPDGHALILDTSRKVVGLCRLAEIKRDKVVVMFTKPLCWELKISSGRGPEEFTTFYTVSASGGVSLPKERLGQADVNAAIQHTFGNRAHSHAIWTVIGHALRQKHGTMVVISNAAEAEANRLSSQSTKLKQPRLLDEGLVLAVTSIDGAVLLDRKGKCHAIGVILDGPVSRNGDSSRGARFNSGWRYYDQAKRNKQQVLIVIVSEDGYVTMIPQKP
ncbi:hypothetical protein PTSG_02954 [Salpingoeca rosetta]|uniref:DAC domain-containing protein n=1 Tax=Salpingoeca rosetta (strain ATCC 50818 / BSB-021) TaxID=946362 RepID=F2U3U1_SALR5|nr:uncharacterized protein PTSG_02954 [Salpingoeca rosetta]EGD82285.1 hypothetical protein PTSG_02954 [Salpingoeca rosetta]|eukprot:XP_004996468.1 hypothetical protein PTSG_02954 [Salpingoeca rosetta]